MGRSTCSHLTRRIIENMKSFIKTYKHFFWTLLLLPLLFWFKYLEATNIPKFIIYSPLDDLIPFIPIFVIPYLLWFFYVAFGLIYTGIHSKKDFYRMLTFMGIAMAFSYTIYAIFPHGQNLRPVITGSDPFSLLIKHIYETDTSTNVCPSLHVINSIATHSALRHSEAFSKIKYGKLASGLMLVFICMSTVLIKQHSIIDVAAGLVTGLVLYMFIYVIPELKERKSYKKDFSPFM